MARDGSPKTKPEFAVVLLLNCPKNSWKSCRSFSVCHIRQSGGYAGKEANRHGDACIQVQYLAPPMKKEMERTTCACMPQCEDYKETSIRITSYMYGSNKKLSCSQTFTLTRCFLRPCNKETQTIVEWCMYFWLCLWMVIFCLAHWKLIQALAGPSKFLTYLHLSRSASPNQMLGSTPQKP